MPQGLAGWKNALRLGAGVAGAVFLASLFVPNSFRSEARLLPVEGKTLGGGNLMAAAAAFGLNLPSAEGADANFVDVLKSRWMAEQLLDAPFTYGARPWRFGAECTLTTTLAAFLKARNRDRAVEELGARLRVTRDAKSRVVLLSMETTSPGLSQQVVQKAVELLETFVQRKGRTRGSAKAAFAEARVKEARAELGQAEDEFRRFLENNRNYLLSPDPTTRLRGLHLEAELKLRQQLVATLAVNREQALLEEKNDLPIVNVLDPGSLPIEKSRPARVMTAASVFVLATLATWAWSSRSWILARMTEPDPPGPDPDGGAGHGSASR